MWATHQLPERLQARQKSSSFDVADMRAKPRRGLGRAWPGLDTVGAGTPITIFGWCDVRRTHEREQYGPVDRGFPFSVMRHDGCTG